MKTLFLPVSGEVHHLSTESIIRIKASSNYSKVYYRNGVYPIVAAKLLRWFEPRLSPSEFIRIHNSYIINRQYIAQLKEDGVVELKDGTKLTIARRRKKQVMKMLAA